MSDEPEAVETLNPVTMIHNVLAEVDPEAMCLGFVAVAEMMGPDGDPYLAVIASPMPSWHQEGILAAATRQARNGQLMVSYFDPNAECTCGECDSEDDEE